MASVELMAEFKKLHSGEEFLNYASMRERYVEFLEKNLMELRSALLALKSAHEILLKWQKESSGNGE